MSNKLFTAVVSSLLLIGILGATACSSPDKAMEKQSMEQNTMKKDEMMKDDKMMKKDEMMEKDKMMK